MAPPEDATSQNLRIFEAVNHSLLADPPFIEDVLVQMHKYPFDHEQNRDITSWFVSWHKIRQDNSRREEFIRDLRTAHDNKEYRPIVDFLSGHQTQHFGFSPGDELSKLKA
ncbi:hypothetical protein C8R46DRAFT_1200546, partial [Mycena filopes]